MMSHVNKFFLVHNLDVKSFKKEFDNTNVKIKQVPYWAMWDLDTILHIGNETCSYFRCIDKYLSFGGTGHPL